MPLRDEIAAWCIGRWWRSPLPAYLGFAGIRQLDWFGLPVAGRRLAPSLADLAWYVGDALALAIRVASFSCLLVRVLFGACLSLQMPHAGDPA
jgi:hypothetical protein